MNFPLPPGEPSRRDDIQLGRIGQLPTVQNVNRHSTKVNDFFGLPLPSSPPASCRGEILNSAETNALSEPRSSTTYFNPHATVTGSPRLKEQHPTMAVHARRAKRFLTAPVQWCAPVWFTLPTSLALLALSLRLLPLTTYTFSALRPLSNAFYIASLALFIPTSILFILRIALFPHATYRQTVHEGTHSGLELGYLSAWPAGWVLLVAYGGFAVAEGEVGYGPGADRLATAVYVCWWLGAVAAGVVVMFVMGCLMSTKAQCSNKTKAGRFAPLIGFLVCMHSVGMVAFVGGLFAWLKRRAPEGESGVGEGLFSPGMTTPLLVFSLCATGPAWFMANLVYGILLHELVLIMGWPPPEHTATVFSMIGPLGQSASALVVLGQAAGRADGGSILGGGVIQPGTVTGLTAMAPLQVVCVLLALLIGGMAAVWLVFAIVVLLYRLFRRELVWNPSWNGMVSPLATLAILCIMLAMALDAGFFRIAACVLIVASVLLVVVNICFTAWTVAKAKSGRDLTATGTNIGQTD